MSSLARTRGKNTPLLELAREFEKAAVYMAGDEPDAALPGFWERCWTKAETGRNPVRLSSRLDEIHNLRDWAGTAHETMG